MNFQQWLLGQSPKTFSIVNSATTGRFTLLIGFGGQTEGEIHDLTNADLQALQKLLNQKFPPSPPPPTRRQSSARK